MGALATLAVGGSQVPRDVLQRLGDYPDYLYKGRTVGLLGKARVFTL